MGYENEDGNWVVTTPIHINPAEQRRIMALEVAVRIGSGIATAEAIIKKARLIEKYLEGGENAELVR